MYSINLSNVRKPIILHILRESESRRRSFSFLKGIYYIIMKDNVFLCYSSLYCADFMKNLWILPLFPCNAKVVKRAAVGCCCFSIEQFGKLSINCFIFCFLLLWCCSQQKSYYCYWSYKISSWRKYEGNVEILEDRGSSNSSKVKNYFQKVTFPIKLRKSAWSSSWSLIQ